jgi:hypothetical protein
MPVPCPESILAASVFLNNGIPWREIAWRRIRAEVASSMKY